MEGEIVQGPIGEVGSYDVKFLGGKLIAKVDANLPMGSAGVILEISAANVIDAIKAAIPGQIDDAILELLKKALGV